MSEVIVSGGEIGLSTVGERGMMLARVEGTRVDGEEGLGGMEGL